MQMKLVSVIITGIELAQVKVVMDELKHDLIILGMFLYKESIIAHQYLGVCITFISTGLEFTL